MSEERKVLSFISHPISDLEFSVLSVDGDNVLLGFIKSTSSVVIAIKSGEEWYHLERAFVKDLAWYKLLEKNDGMFLCVDAEEELQ